MGRYGIEIRGAALQTMDLSGDGKESHGKAATKRYVAKQEADAARLMADATGYAISVEGEKEAEALTKRLEVIKTYGYAGMALAGYDAIRTSGEKGNTIVWGNNPLSGLKDMLAAKAGTPKE